ncbi:MAG: hypothetical protein QHG99_00095 [Methanomicrobiales archaeon]|nr:hypothetical protein [Methanomicrobiales archaeon]
MPAGWSYPEVWGPVRIPANARNFSVMLPVIPDWRRDLAFSATPAIAGTLVSGWRDGIVRGPDVRVMPKPVAERASFAVSIDPDDLVRERNEENNR